MPKNLQLVNRTHSEYLRFGHRTSSLIAMVPVSQPLYEAISGLSYHHACERRMSEHAEQYFHPFPYPQVPNTPQQNVHTHPSSPSMKPALPDLRRTMHRSSAADSSSSNHRFHSQPARQSVSLAAAAQNGCPAGQRSYKRSARFFLEESLGCQGSAQGSSAILRIGLHLGWFLRSFLIYIYIERFLGACGSRLPNL